MEAYHIESQYCTAWVREMRKYASATAQRYVVLRA